MHGSVIDRCREKAHSYVLSASTMQKSSQRQSLRAQRCPRGQKGTGMSSFATYLNQHLIFCRVPIRSILGFIRAWHFGGLALKPGPSQESSIRWNSEARAIFKVSSIPMFPYKPLKRVWSGSHMSEVQIRILDEPSIDPKQQMTQQGELRTSG